MWARWLLTIKAIYTGGLVWMFGLACLVAFAACGRIGFDSNGQPTADGYAPTISGIVARYPMDDDPTTGTMTSIPTGLEGTCVSCPVSTDGRIGNGYQFAGSSIVVSIPTSSLVGIAPYTVAVWMRPMTPATRGCAVNKPYSDTSAYNVFSFTVFSSGDVDFETTVDGNSSVALHPTPTTDLRGAWHHVAATWDGTTKSIYVDGTAAGSMAATPADSALAIDVGADRDNGTPHNYYAGSLDELEFYSRALDAAEVATLANP